MKYMLVMLDPSSCRCTGVGYVHVVQLYVTDAVYTVLQCIEVELNYISCDTTAGAQGVVHISRSVSFY